MLSIADVSMGVFDGGRPLRLQGGLARRRARPPAACGPPRLGASPAGLPRLKAPSPRRDRHRPHHVGDHKLRDVVIRQPRLLAQHLARMLSEDSQPGSSGSTMGRCAAAPAVYALDGFDLDDVGTGVRGDLLRATTTSALARKSTADEAQRMSSQAIARNTCYAFPSEGADEATCDRTKSSPSSKSVSSLHPQFESSSTTFWSSKSLASRLRKQF